MMDLVAENVSQPSIQDDPFLALEFDFEAVLQRPLEDLERPASHACWEAGSGRAVPDGDAWIPRAERGYILALSVTI
jgi:hypothetical protein